MIIEALIIALVFRTFLYQPFSIPTASMQSTLMIGDYFIANKWAYGFGKYSFPVPLPFNGRLLEFATPQQGDIAVFHNITDEDYIKRIIGLPGDRIQMKEGRLYINGTMVEREQVGHGDRHRQLADRAMPVTVYQRDAAQRRDPHHPGNLATTSRSTIPPSTSCRPATTS